ncbi:hypothetical protein C8Q75DRAFT_810179 [Abortiporus biennis]|nr:hypothetical protein C8Q75DRAFT_810179 [Abortiporus biennis]
MRATTQPQRQPHRLQRDPSSPRLLEEIQDKSTSDFNVVLSMSLNTTTDTLQETQMNELDDEQLTEFHQVYGPESSSLVAEREYGDFDASDDSAERRKDVDARAIHSDEERDTWPSNVSGIGREDWNTFGGENGEYDDANPEDDETFGEALSEGLGAEEGTTSADEGPEAFGETQGIFPGSDER